MTFFNQLIWDMNTVPPPCYSPEESNGEYISLFPGILRLFNMSSILEEYKTKDSNFYFQNYYYKQSLSDIVDVVFK